MTPSCKWPIVPFSLNNVIWTRFENDRNKKCFTNKQSGLSQFYTGINFFQWMEKSCLKKTLTPQIPVTTHANLVQLLTSLSLRAIQKLLHKGKRSQPTNAREKCKKCTLNRKNPMKLIFQHPCTFFWKQFHDPGGLCNHFSQWNEA